MRTPLLIALGALLAGPAAAQTTRAERTDYRETSTYDDVMDFLDSLEQREAGIRTWTLTRSTQGRAVPVVLAARPMVEGATEAHRTGKPIVYIQANIHAGEVEGKEAAQMLLRDLTVGPLRPLLDSVIVLVVPIYNADGNEQWDTGAKNRPGQNGPDRVGKRGNGQGLDLNRDYVKLEAPETRASAELLDRWQPHLFIDLHTTNGSYHGYTLTYSPGLNPNDTPANAYTRERFLPEIRERMRKRHGEETFWYGNFRNQTPDSLRLGWETYDGRARYGTNWFGMRGGMAILSEAYSNNPFRQRVLSTYRFVREILSLAAEERKTVLQVSDRARLPAAEAVAVRSTYGEPTTQPVIVEITHEAGEGSGGYARRQRTGEFRTIRMPVYDRFVATRIEALPASYLIPARLERVVALVQRHGIPVTRLPGGWKGRAEVFTIDSVVRAERAFEGHRTVRVEGRWQPGPVEDTGAWVQVTTDQPLGVLAAYLLEPASEDGIVTWNFLDDELKPNGTYPILRIRR